MLDYTHKLLYSVVLNNREIDIELRGFYRPPRSATYYDPPEGDQMELIDVIFKYETHTIGNVKYYKDVSILFLFSDDELDDFNDMLYSNGESIDE